MQSYIFLLYRYYSSRLQKVIIYLVTCTSRMWSGFIIILRSNIQHHCYIITRGKICRLIHFFFVKFEWSYAICKLVFMAYSSLQAIGRWNTRHLDVTMLKANFPTVACLRSRNKIFFPIIQHSFRVRWNQVTAKEEMPCHQKVSREKARYLRYLWQMKTFWTHSITAEQWFMWTKLYGSPLSIYRFGMNLP